MGRSPCCSKEGLKRGPWSSKEDSLLTDYILRNGEGQWRSLPNKAGLLRCGKSCRLRWMNYLRPGIKRGNISQDEEDLIVRLHALLGNRWSLIAGRLPGRTDNEIKNYWNTHLLKKLTTAGRIHRPPPQNKKKKSSSKPDSSADDKIEDKFTKTDPPKIKVYSPKPMRVSPGFSRSSSYDSGTSASASAGGGISYGWFGGGEEGGEEDDFLGTEELLPALQLLQQQQVVETVAGDERMMLDLVYDEYLQLL